MTLQRAALTLCLVFNVLTPALGAEQLVQVDKAGRPRYDLPRYEKEGNYYVPIDKAGRKEYHKPRLKAEDSRSDRSRELRSNNRDR